MSDNVRDKEVRDKIVSLLTDRANTVRWNQAKKAADQIITLIRKEGYMHGDDIAKGWEESCSACKQRAINKYGYLDRNVCDLCRNGEAAANSVTVQEVLDKKAVPA